MSGRKRTASIVTLWDCERAIERLRSQGAREGGTGQVHQRLRNWLAEREKLAPSIKVGDEVIGGVGTKGGIGVVKEIQGGMAVVDFGHCEYPQTMVTPTGTYFLPIRSVQRAPTRPTPEAPA